MRVFFSTLLACAAFACHAGSSTQQLAQAKAAFERQLPGSRFDEDAAFGDFNGDGIPDFVAFVDGPHGRDGNANGPKMAVFLGSKDGSFKYLEMSSDTFAHERAFQSLEIKRQSIFLHRDGSGGCCSHWVEEFQFKLRDGRLMLIGLETSTLHPEGVNDPDTGSSANLATGRVMKWTGTGKKRRETWKAVPGLAPVPFKEFSYDGLSDKWSRVLW